MNEKLDSLWQEYRQACPDPESSATFMPSLWQRIERQRRTTWVFRRLAQVCLAGGVALAIAISMVIPHLQRLPVYSATYVDVLASALPNNYVDIVTGDIK